MELTDKAAVVTGAAVRVGRAIALELARAGCDVLVHFHRSESAAEELAVEIAAMGRRAATVCADLAHPADACERILSAADRMGPRLDVLVNNAAAYEPGSAWQMPREQWARLMAVNFQSPAMLAEQAAARMQQADGGAIVNLLDVLAFRPWARYAAYCQTKAALWSATVGLARSGALRVRVNGVAPGIVLWNDAEADLQRRAELIEKIPLRRAGQPGDVAAAVRMLVENDYITGQVLCVDGGRSMG